MDKISIYLLKYLAAIATVAGVDSNYSANIEDKIHNAMIEYDNKLQNDINIISGQKSDFWKQAEEYCQLYTDEKKKTDLYREKLEECFVKLKDISHRLDIEKIESGRSCAIFHKSKTIEFVNKIKGEIND